MASDGDLVVVQNSMNDNMTESKTVPFYDKNYTFINYLPSCSKRSII